MKCVQMNSYGHAEVLNFIDIPVPEVGPDDVLVEVKAVAINILDYKLMAGMLKYDIPQEMPVIIGSDFAGIVVDHGVNCSQFPKGFMVYGSGVSFNGDSGSLAEYVRVNKDHLSLMPKNQKFPQAASMVTPGCAAMEAVEAAKVKPGQKVLIHAAGTIAGAFAVQLCLEKGAQVAVTVNNNEIDYMKSIGADMIINNSLQPFEDIIKNYDIVIDINGGTMLNRSYGVLKKGGRLISLLGHPDKTSLEKHGIKGEFVMTKINTAELDKLSNIIENGSLKPYDLNLSEFEKSISSIDKNIKGESNGMVVIKFKD